MMRKFLFRGTLFVIGGILIAQVLALVITTLQFDSITDYRLQVDQFLQQSSEIELVTLGNSYNLSLDLDRFDQKGYHLWRNAGDFFELQYLAEQLIDDSLNIETALIPASYFSFHIRKSAWERLRKDRQAMYTVMPSWHFIDAQLPEFIWGKINLIFPLDILLREDHWEAVIPSIVDKSLRTANTGRGKDGQELSSGYANCEHKALEELVTFTNEVGIPEYEEGQNHSLQMNPNLPAEAYATAVEIIQMLQAQDIRVVFYTPPYFEAYNDLYDKETVATMKGYMAQLQEEHSVEYYDFSTDPEFTREYRLFYDDDHLNQCGAKIFSAKFNQILIQNAP